MTPSRPSLPSPPVADIVAGAEAKLPTHARGAVVALLELESLQPRIDDAGNIAFRCKDFNYVLVFSRHDPEFVRLVLPNFWPIESDSERSLALAAANTTNRTCKAAKVWVEGTQVQASIEHFSAAHEHIVPVLLRSAGALAHAVHTFGAACTLQRGQ